MTQVDKQEIIEILREMERSYRYMGGDYDFVKAIVRWAQGMSTEHRQMLLQTLFELMMEEGEFGGYTLDVLIGLGATEWAPKLESILPLAARDNMWYGDVIRALMEMKYEKLLPLYLQYIRDLVNQNNPRWIVYAALLYRMDREEALSQSSAYLIRWLKSDRQMRAVSEYISVFVRRYCETNCDDLVELVRCTAQKNRDAGYRLAYLLKQELQRSYTTQKIGDDKVHTLVDALNKFQTEI